MDASAKLTSKGQVTLPKMVRDALGVAVGDRVLFRIVDDVVVVAKVPDLLQLRGSVPLPPEARGRSWDEIRAEARRRRAEKRR